MEQRFTTAAASEARNSGSAAAVTRAIPITFTSSTRANRTDPGVVDQNVEAAKLVSDGLDGTSDRLSAGHIADDAVDPVRQLVRCNVEHGYSRTAFCKKLRRRKAYARCPARDRCHESREFCHVRL